MWLLQVFFIRDGFKFPDLVHALRPNPVNNIQEAWRFLDFLSYHPESAHIVRRSSPQTTQTFIMACPACSVEPSHAARAPQTPVGGVFAGYMECATTGSALQISFSPHCLGPEHNDGMLQ